MGGQRPANAWGSTKIQRTLSVTEDCWRHLTDSCEQHGINRSEWLEVMSRYVNDLQIDVAAIRKALVSNRKPPAKVASITQKG
jgi:hypothetical protein